MSFHTGVVFAFVLGYHLGTPSMVPTGHSMLEADTNLQDRYRVIRQIGKGGMGTVYLAKDENLGITVAVKQNFFADPRLIEAFKREARLLAGLRHPALPRVIDHFIDLTGQYLVMEYIPGEDMGASLEKRKKEIEPIGEPKPFEVEEVVRWAEQLLDALEYLHNRPEPIIHRDIKPQNLKLAERNQIILLDFGLAKGKPLNASRVTTTGSIYGYTPAYAPIEQIRGLGTDPRSDLYALAATVYHLITGVPPIDAATRADAHLGREPDPLRPADELNEKLPHEISALLAKAMEQHRNYRPASAGDMLSMLSTAKRSSVVETAREDERQRPDAAPTDRYESGTPSSGDAETLLAEENVRATRSAEIETRRAAPEVPSDAYAQHMLDHQQEGTPVGETTGAIPETIRSLPGESSRAGVQSQTGQSKKMRLIVSITGVVLILLVAMATVLISKRDTPSVSSGSKPEADPASLHPGKFDTPSKIFKVSLSDDGRAVASAGDEPVVRLWQPDGGRELIGHMQRGRSVAVSHDGQNVASGSEDGSIRLWRASDGQLINSWLGHSYYVFGMGFSPDGKMLFSASADKTIKLWRVSDGGLIKTVQSPEAGYLIVTVSPDLRMAGYYRDDASFKMWSVTEDTLIRKLDGMVPMVSCGAFSGDGQMLALGSADGAVQVWRVSDGRMARALGKFNESIRSVTFSGDGKTLAASLEHGAIKLWRISDGNLITTLEGHTESVDCLAFRADSRALVSGSDDKTVRVWSLEAY
jgi:serine/threonine protein kinase